MGTRSTAVLGVIAVAAALVCLPKGVSAADGNHVVLPLNILPKHGLKLAVNPTWVNSPGYVPLHLELRTSDGVPSAADRRLQVRVTPHCGTDSKHYSGEIMLPRGQVSAINHVLIPQSTPWWQLSIETFEGGERLEDLSSRYMQTHRNPSGFDSNPKVLIIDPRAPTLATRGGARNQGYSLPTGTYELPDVRGLAHWIPTSNFWGDSSQPMDDASLIAMVEQISHLELLPPVQLPDRWIGYSSLDVIFISLPHALAVRQQHAAKWESLKKWAAAGGNLVVFDVGRDYQQLARLEGALELNGRTGAPLDRWLRGGDAQSNSAQLRQLVDDEWAIIERSLTNSADSASNKTPEEIAQLRRQWQAETIEDPAWFPMRYMEYGHGKIVAMPDADPFPGSALKWHWLDQTIKPYKSWQSRGGVNLEGGDDRYYNHLIPDVGLPPVDTFRLLITLFVIVIGPVNYLLLKNRKRLFLLLVTVPVGAAIVTLSLFGYALIKDGLSVRTRVQSFATLDQRAGLASSWSRQTYFASLPPSRGLTFPGTSTVHVITPDEYRARWAHQRSYGSWIWEGENQRLARGYLSSRTTAEFLVANSTPIGEANLEFSRPAAGEPLQVKNLLGVGVDHLLLVDLDGAPFWLNGLQPGQTATPEPIDMAEAMQRLQEMALANRSIDPLAGQRGRGLFWNSNNPGPVAGIGQGVVGKGREEALSAVPGNSQELQPGEFLAVLSQSPEFVPLGVRSTRESASFHVIKGRYVIQ